MIQTQDLTFQYQKGGNMLRFPNIELGEKEHLLILGKSGIGKTTLLHLLAGLLTPVTGSVEIAGTQLHELSARKMDLYRGKNVGLVFQQNYAIQSLTLLENLKARLYFSDTTISNTAIDHLLQQLNLEGCKDHKPSELSEGQLQRLGIALSVIHRPQVILADEPTSSLDDDNCRAVMQLLIDQAEQNNANLIVITHDHRIKSSFSKTLEL